MSRDCTNDPVEGSDPRKRTGGVSKKLKYDAFYSESAEPKKSSMKKGTSNKSVSWSQDYSYEPDQVNWYREARDTGRKKFGSCACNQPEVLPSTTSQ